MNMTADELRDLIAMSSLAIEALHVSATGKNMRNEDTDFDTGYYDDASKCYEAFDKLGELFDIVDLCVIRGESITFTK